MGITPEEETGTYSLAECQIFLWSHEPIWPMNSQTLIQLTTSYYMYVCTSFSSLSIPLIDHFEVLDSFLISRLISGWLPLRWWLRGKISKQLLITAGVNIHDSYRVISINASLAGPCLTKSFNCKKQNKKILKILIDAPLTCLALPNRLGRPHNPKQIAHTKLDFPVPVQVCIYRTCIYVVIHMYMQMF